MIQYRDLGIPSFRCTADAFDHVNAYFASSETPICMLWGLENINQNEDPGAAYGSVVFVPTQGPIVAARGMGTGDSQGGQIILGVMQSVDIYCWARDNDQTDPLQQNKADARAVELLRNLVLDAFEKLVPGLKEGLGRTTFGKPVENSWGARIVVSFSILIDVHAPPLTPLAPPAPSATALTTPIYKFDGETV